VTPPTYRLPDWLGGAECALVRGDHEFREGAVLGGSTEVRITAGVSGGTGVTMTVPRRILTRVEPALPPEPPVGSVVWVQELDRDLQAGIILRRYVPGWCSPGSDDAPYDWAGVCALSTTPPVLLVPDPAAGADTEGRFPGTTNGPYAFVAGLNGGRVRLRVVDSHDESATVDLSREVTEALGRTLLAAARAARAS